MKDSSTHHPAPFTFPELLREGIILARPNRFIMDVLLEGETVRCHCPVVSRIGSLDLTGRPCLVSESSSKGRKTPFTVEAFSLDQPDAPRKQWIGINQTASNRCVQHFLEQGALSTLSGPVEQVSREVRLGSSRLDFLINENLYLEMKTPLVQIQTDIPPYVPRLPESRSTPQNAPCATCANWQHHWPTTTAPSSSTVFTTRTAASAITTAPPTTK